ncbi:Plug domain-containing protein, partial [Paraburkholderia sp.]|uniref:Plug domain-containing protein n=1 Tax=Paraburkholderia sp. TaxID=1926495 RepID=UPI00286ED916
MNATSTPRRAAGRATSLRHSTSHQSRTRAARSTLRASQSWFVGAFCAASVVAHAAQPAAPVSPASGVAATESSTPSTQADTAQASSSRATALPTVTVTATRRNESAQKVPIALTVVSGAEMERAGNNTVQSLVTAVPELTFKPSLSSKDTTLTIRGVGTNSTSPGVEPSVSTVIDGVV